MVDESCIYKNSPIGVADRGRLSGAVAFFSCSSVDIDIEERQEKAEYAAREKHLSEYRLTGRPEVLHGDHKDQTYEKE